jgi:transposase
MSTFVRRKRVVSRGRSYVYLQLVRNQRVKGKLVQRVLHNLGPEDQLDRTEVDRTVAALAPFTKKAIVLKGPEDIDLESATGFGDSFVIEQMWRQLGLDRVLAMAPQDRRLELDVELLCRCMVTNRLVWPISKLATTRWVGRDVEFSGLDEGLDVQNFYRAMDHLLPHKERIENHLFDRLTTLFNLDVSLVFYDTTLAYFEGDGMEDLVRFSRKNKKLEKKEVLICVVMSRDGFPIYHEVLPGNRNDVSTVKTVVRKLKERFQIKECVFVGDGGMHSKDNIRVIEKELKFKTIVGVPLRGRAVVRDEILRRPGRYHTIKKNLHVKEVDVDGQRYILGFNPEEARREKSRRIHLLTTLQKKIDALPRAKDPVKARARILADRQRAQYLWRPKKKRKQKQAKDAPAQAAAQKKKQREPRLYPLRIDRNRVRKSARYDGKHVIQTSAPLGRDEVARIYRDLQRLEYCFKHLKSAAVWIRPVRHWRDRRIRAHVLLCIIALVIERMIQRRLDDAGMDLEAPRALEELARIRAAVEALGDRTFRVRTEPTPEAVAILDACRVHLPPRVEELTDDRKALR